jgi:hypothetical protein
VLNSMSKTIPASSLNFTSGAQYIVTTTVTVGGEIRCAMLLVLLAERTSCRNCLHELAMFSEGSFSQVYLRLQAASLS